MFIRLTKVESIFPKRVAPDSVMIGDVGTIVTLIGISLMVGSPSGSTMFWVGTGEGLLGITSVILSVMMRRADPTTPTIEEYKALLKSDQNNHYELYDSHYLQGRKATDTADLMTDTAVDFPRILWKVNGESVNHTDVQGKEWESVSNAFSNSLAYANQSTFADLRAVLASRYLYPKDDEITHDEKEIILANKIPYNEGGLSSRFDFITSQEDKVTRLEGETHFCLCPANRDPVLKKYIVGKIIVDFATGSALYKWSSPQDEYPNFD